MAGPVQFVPYMLLVGLLTPIPTWLLHKRYPTVGFNNIFVPILVGARGSLPSRRPAPSLTALQRSSAT
jgi:hypothetical protein